MAGAIILIMKGQPGPALGLAATGLWLLQATGFNWLASVLPKGPRTRVQTDHLDGEVDAGGRLSGRIVKGFFQGRRVEKLRPVELAHLWYDCRLIDPASARLVEAHLDAVHATWREDIAAAEASRPRGPDGKMRRDEALEILGLGPDATADDIRRAHHHLIQRFHPDRGGSTYLAAKINEAKDVALGGR